MLCGTLVFAQSSSLVPTETTSRALKIAKQIEDQNLTVVSTETVDEIALEKLSGAAKLRELRFLTMDAAGFRNYVPLEDLLAIYGKEARRQNSRRDIAIADIIDLQAKIYGFDTKEEPGKSYLSDLQNYRSNADWLVAQRAALFEAILPTFKGDYDVSLKETQNALQMIPNEISRDVIEAQYETYDQIAFLHFHLSNIQLGVDTTVQVIEKGLAQNRYIDGVGLVNNLAFVFNSWHEYETAEKIAEILFRLQKSGDTVNSLAYYRFGQAQNNVENYGKALVILEEALANTDDLVLKTSIEMQKAVAYAGLGKTDEAKQSLAVFEKNLVDAELNSAEYETNKLKALALIALAEKDFQSSGKLLNARLKSKVQYLLDQQSKGIQSLQANLENDKNRVAERESALMRETQLKQSELDAQQRSNVFLMALAALLLLIAAAATAFAVWRQKISKILVVAAHDAEAGDRAKSQFLSVMSHELRTPLNGIIGIAGILSEKGETQELRNYNKLILKSGENLLQLLSGILDMAQMESGKLSIVTAPTSIRQITDGLYQSAKSNVDDAKIQFTCFVADNVPDDLMLDSIRIKQALSNLISNAVRFTESGRIHLHTTMSDPDRNGVRDLTIIVADTGLGITDDVKEKLFKPFVQADSSLTRTHDGAGIGLAVTRGLSRLMGGDVTMTSTAGRGSEFKMVVKTCAASDAKMDTETNRPIFIVVPSASTKIDFSPAVSIEKLRADAAAKEKAMIKEDLFGAQDAVEPDPDMVPTTESIEFSDDDDGDFETIGGVDETFIHVDRVVETPVVVQTPPENPRAGFSRQQPRSDGAEIEPDQLSGLNVLVVEDIEANLEILRSLLEPVGCSVSCAENGKVAVELMKSQTFDAVIMDIRMPVMDGIEATKAIRALPEPQCDTAIIALTADASAENNAECLAAGADVFLTKPVIVSELFSSIRFARLKQLRQKQQALSA